MALSDTLMPIPHRWAWFDKGGLVAVGDEPATPAEIGRQLDEAIGFVPMSKPPQEVAPTRPFPARALRYGPGEAPLIEWPE